MTRNYQESLKRLNEIARLHEERVIRDAEYANEYTCAVMDLDGYSELDSPQIVELAGTARELPAKVAELVMDCLLREKAEDFKPIMCLGQTLSIDEQVQRRPYRRRIADAILAVLRTSGSVNKQQT